MRTLTILVLLAALIACGKLPEVPKPAEPQSRVETQLIRNTDAIGYSDAAIANKVGGALEANDQRKAELDSAIDAESNPR